jgi:hypothetical protein
MEWTIDGIRRILELSTYAFAGWVISWLVFFALLPYMTAVLGKLRGAAVNYGLSWVVMATVILGLEFGIKKEDDFEEPISTRF